LVSKITSSNLSRGIYFINIITEVNTEEDFSERREPFGANGKLKYLPMLCP